MKKVKLMKKMAAVIMAGTMMTALAVPVMAESVPQIGGVKNVTITKSLTKYANSYAPNTTFSFKIQSGTASGDGKIYAGPAGGVVFNTGKDSVAFAPASGDIGKTTLTGTTQLTVVESAFTNAGVYRYLVSEVIPSAKYDGVVYSTETKIFDVYKFSDGSFSYVFEDERGAKDDGVFDNTYVHGTGGVNDLTIAKTVTGKLGVKSNKFAFTIAVAPSNSGEKFLVKDESGNVLKSNWDGTAATISLANDQKAVIYGLSANDTYTVTETVANQDGYTTTIDNVKTTTGTASGKITADKTISYVNDKDTTVPTGIAMDIEPYAIMVAAAFLLGFAFLRTRRVGKNK